VSWVVREILLRFEQTAKTFMFSITGILGSPLAATSIVIVKELYLHEKPEEIKGE
jgi:hypothetical protein